MTNEEILNKLLQKAFGRDAVNFELERPETIIFNHKFAKAFWGEDARGRCGECGAFVDGWEQRLSEMVLEEEPLKYIEKFL